MASKAAIKRIIETLKEIYPDALCSLQYEKDYELLFAVRLSAQCTDVYVEVGDTVSAGQTIGTVGDTAAAEAAQGPHLHFSVTKDGDVVDPDDFLNQ